MSVVPVSELRIPEDHVAVFVGPTASGKTEAAIQFAERTSGEIVSVDSVQIYRHFDIGSGKPTPEQLARAPHHLIGVRDPLDPVDAFQYGELARAAIQDIRDRGKTPILCGGTFLWVKATVEGLVEGAPSDPEVRARHKNLAELEGRLALHNKLRAVDPSSAERLSPNDFVRVSRALEIHELTGKPQSAWFRQHGFRSKKMNHIFVAVHREREELDERIRVRTQTWLKQGWREEVTELLARGYGDARAMASVGYKEVRANVEGRLADTDVESAVVRATRTFVRRQRTWLRDRPLVWVR